MLCASMTISRGMSACRVLPPMLCTLCMPRVRSTPRCCRLSLSLACQVTYPAELAGLHYGVRPTVAGLLLSVYGYDDTLPTLAQAGGGPGGEGRGGGGVALRAPSPLCPPI